MRGPARQAGTIKTTYDREVVVRVCGDHARKAPEDGPGSAVEQIEPEHREREIRRRNRDQAVQVDSVGKGVGSAKQLEWLKVEEYALPSRVGLRPLRRDSISEPVPCAKRGGNTGTYEMSDCHHEG